MATSPNGQRNPLNTPRTNVVELFATLTGAGAADMVNADAALPGGGEIVSAVRTGAGAYTFTLRKQWPQLLFAPTFSFQDPTATAIAGFDGVLIAQNVSGTTPTMSVVFSSGNTATDIPITSTVYIRWTVRAVSKN